MGDLSHLLWNLYPRVVDRHLAHRLMMQLNNEDEV